MGPIYGTIFTEMAETADGSESINLALFKKMLETGQESLYDVVDARVGDKTLVDTLAPSIGSLETSIREQLSFSDALDKMKAAAQAGMESTKDLIARYGRSSRLGERSRGVLDAGAVSCNILLKAIADGIQEILREQ